MQSDKNVEACAAASAQTKHRRFAYVFSVGKFSLVLSRSDSGRNSGILPDVSRRFLTCAGTRTKCPRHESGSMPELRVINSSTHTLPRAESAVHSNAVLRHSPSGVAQSVAVVGAGV